MSEPAGLSAVIEPLIALILVGIGVAWYKQLAVGGGGSQVRRHSPRTTRTTGGQSLSSARVSERSDWDERGRSPRYIGARPRQVVIVAQNVADHPYDELVLTDLHDHLFEGHFEVWNMTAASGSPSRWRREHAADHGLVLK